MGVSRVVVLVVAAVLLVIGLVSLRMIGRRESGAQTEAGGAVAGAVADQDAKPVAGATVSAFRVMKPGAKQWSEPNEDLRTTTDADGVFRLAGVPPGMYLVSATATGHTAATAERPIAVFARETEAVEVRLAKRGGFLLSGRVRDAQQTPIAGASIRLIGVQLPLDKRSEKRLAFATSTDTTGDYRLEVPPGRYQLRVTSPGRRAAKGSLDLTADQARDFQLQPAKP